MFTTGAKYFFGITVFAVVAAVVYGMATYGHAINLSSFTGVISLGYKGGVGEHLGYSILVGLAGASAFLGGVVSVVRDADPQPVTDVTGPEAVAGATPAARLPVGASYWPAFVAFGAAIVVLGLVLTEKLFIVGWILVGIGAVEWAVRSWAERATGDLSMNQSIGNRFLTPVELPIFALFGIVIFVFSLSRILLSVNEHASAVVFAAVPAIVLITAVLISTRQQVAHTVLGGVIAVGVVAVLALGVVGLVRGQRQFEHKGEHGHHFVPQLVQNRGLAPAGRIVIAVPTQGEA